MENLELANLESQRDNLSNFLDNLLYGSIRVKIHDGEQFLYVRRLKNGVMKDDFVGEFSRELYDMVLDNCQKAKRLRGNLRDLNKKIAILKSQSNKN